MVWHKTLAKNNIWNTEMCKATFYDVHGGICLANVFPSSIIHINCFSNAMEASSNRFFTDLHRSLFQASISPILDILVVLEYGDLPTIVFADSFISSSSIISVSPSVAYSLPSSLMIALRKQRLIYTLPLRWLNSTNMAENCTCSMC